MALNETELTCLKEELQKVDPELEVVVSMQAPGFSISVQGPAQLDGTRQEASTHRHSLLRAMRNGFNEAFSRNLEDATASGWGEFREGLTMV